MGLGPPLRALLAQKKFRVVEFCPRGDAASNPVIHALDLHAKTLSKLGRPPVHGDDFFVGHATFIHYV